METNLGDPSEAFCSIPIVLMSVPREEDASTPDSSPDSSVDDAGR